MSFKAIGFVARGENRALNPTGRNKFLKSPVFITFNKGLFLEWFLMFTCAKEVQEWVGNE